MYYKLEIQTNDSIKELCNLIQAEYSFDTNEIEYNLGGVISIDFVNDRYNGEYNNNLDNNLNLNVV